MLRRPLKDVAMLLLIMLQRSKQKRARVSQLTLAKIAGGGKLKHGFVDALIREASEYGLLIAELDSGAFGLMLAKSLETAKPILIERLLSDEEQCLLADDELDIGGIYVEFIAKLEPELIEEDES